MCQLLRREGMLHVSVLINEAVNANYSGLHKWNFEVENNKVRLWQPGKEYNLHSWLGDFGNLQIIKNDEASRRLTFELSRIAPTK